MGHGSTEAVSELLRPFKEVIEVTPLVRYTVRAPCLLRQLAQCLVMGSERAGGRAVAGSRATLNVDVLDLWHEIAHDTHSWARALGYSDARRRDPRDRHPIPWVGRLLRNVTAGALSKGETAMADRIEAKALRWARDITVMVTGEAEARGVRAACPECAATTTIEERDGEGRVQVYAIVLVVRPVAGGPLRWLSCRACGWHMSLSDGAPLVHAWNTGEAA